jgi:hypothetical protein
MGVVPLTVLFVVLLCLAWYCGWMAAHRRRAIKILGSIEVALAGEGHISSLRWTSGSRFRAKLSLPSRFFRSPAIQVVMTPKELPWRWLRHARAGTGETLSFEADLESALGFELEVVNKSWFGRSSKLKPDSSNWIVQAAEPVVLATTYEWRSELLSMFGALLSAREQEMLNLEFHEHSPNFRATIALGSLSELAERRPSLFDAFRQLAREASGASHHRKED